MLWVSSLCLFCYLIHLNLENLLKCCATICAVFSMLAGWIASTNVKHYFCLISSGISSKSAARGESPPPPAPSVRHYWLGSFKTSFYGKLVAIYNIVKILRISERKAKRGELWWCWFLSTYIVFGISRQLDFEIQIIWKDWIIYCQQFDRSAAFKILYLW